MRASSTNTALRIVGQKAAKQDTSKPLQLMQRQRTVNQQVVAWMTRHDMHRTLTVDACAGIEGSLWAVHERGGRWIGNEIAEGDVSLLEGTVRGIQNSRISVIHEDAHHLSLDDKMADFYLFVFALAHLRTFDALKEASRIIKDEGRIAICCPGPTYWIMDIMISVALTQHGISPGTPVDQVLRSRPNLTKNITNFAANVLAPVGMTPWEYAQFILKTNFGVRSFDEFIGALERSAGGFKKGAKDWWYSQRCRLDVMYWDNLLACIKKLKLVPVRMGVMPLAEVSRSKGELDWVVGRIFDCEIAPENLYRSELEQMFSRSEIRGLTDGVAARKMVYGRTLLLKKAG
ncbi:hypothetical protein A2311_05860 [candidate division WOR-1 bacterium RIFOXYB2_FULL_48_7]|uniref:Methyltransferase type 11 domain-containing protein n=1 Tax=candidate division WOR-1 bacterium RIFOXYB2_FULL_48_7 TaxID=1802583 RepID=A0A1F4TBF4_UNCSA|nr:MAG: hypothetical protein A2311_05860 [candidate division WOR-1 bacterium RIFOXYB2_FULL_48_7]